VQTGLILFILVLALIAWEVDTAKPIPVALSNGDTLMVRIIGFGFCPKICTIDHHHIGHYKGYACEEEICNHYAIIK
jgi:hypothetical protein